MRVACVALLMLAWPVLAQTPIDVSQFNAAQKVEWARFTEYWYGNGKGTCIPIMQVEIQSGACTSFDFTVHVTIGRNGRIQRAEVVRNDIVCKKENARRELMRCFTQSLREDNGLWDGQNGSGFSALRGRVVRHAAL